MADDRTSEAGYVGTEIASYVASPAVAVIVQPRDVRGYTILESELGMLEDTSPSYELSFFTLTVGLAIGFGATLFTQNLDDRSNATYAALFLVSLVLSLFFGARAYRAQKRNNRVAQSVRERRTTA